MFDLMDDWGPEKTVCVSDSRTGMRGVLVIDNTARGMGKGGTRMSPTVSVGEIARLARNMTWKWAGVDLFYGGAKAGICADPGRSDKEAVLRSFVRALRNEVPEEYVFGLDVGLDERDAAILADEAGRAGAVGTPTALGGLPYDELGVTGFGVAESVDAAAQHLGRETSRLSVAIQGFGAVGAATARRLAELGATVVAVSTARGGVYDSDGLDVDELLRLRTEHGDDLVDHIPSARRLAAGEELTVQADVLVPAALQDVIDGDLAAHIRADIVVEGANLPTGRRAQQVLAGRGVTVVPDVIANAGGVVAAAVAMDSRTSGLRPDTGAVFDSISTKLRSGVGQTLRDAADRGTTTHEAAVHNARVRVHEAMRLKGRLA